uniref:Uncharacterized protein n=1 Tax=Chromera velia CCMP2878 TaxID=1169474 RepID=A0A0G4IBQ3_9ALVE|eukprot:Cvel_12846.t1-p1 / transcript=Cvel_12846.t1 / gene=Cvel_12846 / organism=Chromera_velia_CCMP2878 / gene_product=hypothetical protein / transcript_product=hypothetical protein / location=Cvel_scaffold857:18963-20501(-) / protein_length=167 / sequence_SO=supercontig / SO=protein_coding / is_pseudo=false
MSTARSCEMLARFAVQKPLRRMKWVVYALLLISGSAAATAFCRVFWKASLVIAVPAQNLANALGGVEDERCDGRIVQHIADAQLDPMLNDFIELHCCKHLFFFYHVGYRLVEALPKEAKLWVIKRRRGANDLWWAFQPRYSPPLVLEVSRDCCCEGSPTVGLVQKAG